MFRVPAGGGDCAPLTTLDTARGELGHRFPSFLPDGRHFVYLREAGKPESAGIYVGSLDAKPEQQSSKRMLAADGPAPFEHGAHQRGELSASNDFQGAVGLSRGDGTHERAHTLE